MEATSTPAVEILPALRAATEEPHRQLEDAIDIERRLFHLALYRQLLAAFFGFYEPLELQLVEVGGWDRFDLDIWSRRKTAWLQKDLRALGLKPPQIEALPVCISLPSIDTLARAFGCLYVLEGATLGGRHIMALAKDSPVPAAARNYFNSYGPDTGLRWREFVAALERCAAKLDEAQVEELLDAARETFRCLHAWFIEESEANVAGR